MKTNKLREEIISIFESAGLQEDETSMQMLDMIMGVFDQALAQKEAEVLEYVKKSKKQMEQLKYSEPLDSEMRIVNMIVQSCISIMEKNLNQLKTK